jgi:hypothetical protein
MRLWGDLDPERADSPSDEAIRLGYVLHDEQPPVESTRTLDRRGVRGRS